MAANDPADERGHTHAEAELQEPTLDLGADPASETTPEGNVMVLAQSPAEVNAQIENQAGADGDEHDLAELLEHRRS
jgi:hypothetical protein